MRGPTGSPGWARASRAGLSARSPMQVRGLPLRARSSANSTRRAAPSHSARNRSERNRSERNRRRLSHSAASLSPDRVPAPARGRSMANARSAAWMVRAPNVLEASNVRAAKDVPDSAQSRVVSAAKSPPRSMVGLPPKGARSPTLPTARSLSAARAQRASQGRDLPRHRAGGTRVASERRTPAACDRHRRTGRRR